LAVFIFVAIGNFWCTNKRSTKSGALMNGSLKTAQLETVR